MKGMKTQAGYTIIEVMIVIVILGILASIAAPQYRDYTIKARVTECVNKFAPVKTAVDLYFNENGELPTALTDLSAVSQTPTDYAGDYVATVDLSDVGVCTCTLSDAGALGGAAGRTVVFTPTVGAVSVSWTVSGGTDDDTKLPAKYWPGGFKTL